MMKPSTFLLAAVALSLTLTLFQSPQLTLASPLTKRRLSRDVSHYEPIDINTERLLARHNVAKRSNSASPDFVIPLQFEAYGKSFNVRMQTNHKVFMPNFEAYVHDENGRRPVPIDGNSVYIGTINNEENSIIQGLIHENGDFVATVLDGEGELYMIEPGHRYGRSADNFNSVIYKFSDVEIEGIERDAEEEAYNGLLDLMKRGGLIDNTKMNEMKQRFSPSNLQNWANNSTKAHRQFRRDVSTKYCDLALYADDSFYDKFKGNPASANNVFNKMLEYYNAVNVIYKDPDNQRPFLGFGISFIEAYVTLTGTPLAGASPNEAVQVYLDRFANHELNAYCLGQLFTNRDFSGTLGLAYVGFPFSANTPGGICQTRLSNKNTNAGLTTTRNFGNDVNPTVTIITMAHEIGHNMGSPHDPNGACTPGNSNGGNFIMFYSATDGTRPNNVKFSQCSQNSMDPVIADKGPICFKESINACGNRVVESGEECDCGSALTCTDSCCNPNTCQLTMSSVCSPTATVCCNSNCERISGVPGSAIVCNNTMLNDAQLCLEPATCEIATPVDGCPARQQKPEGALCRCANTADELGCQNSCTGGGLCAGSVCDSLVDAVECECAPEVLDGVHSECAICCNSGSGCEVFPSANSPKRILVGKSCQASTGYCNAAGACIKSNHNQALSDLFDEVFGNISEWIKNNWYVVLAIVIALVLTVIFLRWYFITKPEFVSGGASGDMEMKSTRHGSDPQAMRKRDARQNIKRMFPAVENEVLEGALRASNYDVQSAASQLRQMGYQ